MTDHFPNPILPTAQPTPERRMLLLAGAGLAAASLTATSAEAQPWPAAPAGLNIQVTPLGSRPSVIASDRQFAGTAVVDPLFSATEYTHATGGLVTFAPGARTAWHTHPAGQMLLIRAGLGWVQEEGSERHEVRSGDVVWIQPGVKHWHGATATHSMAHIALSYMRDGSNVTWMEQVTDAQYRG